MVSLRPVNLLEKQIALVEVTSGPAVSHADPIVGLGTAIEIDRYTAEQSK
jgi:hypothetical protein